MIRYIGDIFAIPDLDALVFTTNGALRRTGAAVMGRGIAAEVLRRYPGIDVILGQHIAYYGNHVACFPKRSRLFPTITDYSLVSFPTKPAWDLAAADLSNVVTYKRQDFRAGNTVPGFWCVSSLALIEESTVLLAELATQEQWRRIALPLPGCGQGERQEAEVLPLLSRHLDDRFLVCTRA